MILVPGVFGASVFVIMLTTRIFGDRLTEGTGVTEETGVTEGTRVLDDRTVRAEVWITVGVTIGVTTIVGAGTVAVDTGAWTVMGERVTVGRGIEETVTVGTVVMGLTVVLRSLQLESLQQLILPLRMTQ